MSDSAEPIECAACCDWPLAKTLPVLSVDSKTSLDSGVSHWSFGRTWL